MAIKKIEIRPKGDGTYPDVLYPKTSLDMVEGAQTALDAKAPLTHAQDTSIHVTSAEKSRIATSLQVNTQNVDSRFRNLGQGSAEGIYTLSNLFNKDNPQQIIVYFPAPAQGFTGTLEIELTSTFANSNSSGGYKAIYTFGITKTAFHSTPTRKIIYASTEFSNSYYVDELLHDGNNVYFSIQKRVVYANNPLSMKLKFHGHDNPYPMIQGVQYYVQDTGAVATPLNVDLFTSVSNGKSAVANAITQKGIWTASDAEFATMANNISAISTGAKFASGTTNLSTDRVAFNYNNGNVGGTHFYVTVNGLTFKPRLIFFSYTYSSTHTAVYNNVTGTESVYLAMQTSSYAGNQTNYHMHGNSGTAYVNATSFQLPVVIGQNIGSSSNGGPVTWFAFE